ncbi:MAG TPA: NTP transferase domain-containing protein [Streptosporangiaceae bacterium]
MLAGGQGSRLGGGDKSALIVGRRPLAASVVRAAGAAGARQVIVVGPPRAWLGPAVRVVREQPPGGGPVAALRRGLAEVSAAWVAVLAADLPFLTEAHLAALLAAGSGSSAAGGGSAAGERAAGAVLMDDSGRPQWLAGCWRAAALRAALGGYGGSSMRGLLGPMHPVLLPLMPRGGEPPPWLDCDTPEDLRRARAWCQPAADWPGPEGEVPR